MKMRGNTTVDFSGSTGILVGTATSAVSMAVSSLTPTTLDV